MARGTLGRRRTLAQEVRQSLNNYRFWLKPHARTDPDAGRAALFWLTMAQDLLSELRKAEEDAQE